MQHSIAAKYAARPAARFVPPVDRARERRLGLRAFGTFIRRADAGDRAAPDRSRSARPASRRLALDPAGAPMRPSRGGPRPRVAMHWAGSGRPARGSPLERRDGAVARLRSATATSAGGIVVRFDDGRPQLVVGSPPTRARRRTWTLPKGTPIAGETLEETALREVAEETGLEVRITGPLGLDRVLVRPARARASTRPSTTS